MGRSTSCLKIITCGSGSVEQDDPQAPEIKGDKRGWSFRKRSARHRVLSNSAISETFATTNKESPEPAEINFKPTANSDAPEKVSALPCTDEKPHLPVAVEAKASEPVVSTEPESLKGFHVDEPAVIIIQASIRGLLAHKALLKLKNVVKLQAAVRGHLVRSHAVGTLRCVQAIVKMQALVRARRARQLTEGTFSEKNADLNLKGHDISLKASEKVNANKQSVTIDKLLSNSFARQLLASTPKEKPINIKCDVSKSDSAWKWLERWMSASSTELSSNLESMTEQQKIEKNEKPSDADTETVSEGPFKPVVSASVDEETSAPCQSECNEIHFEGCHQIPAVGKESLEQPKPEAADAIESAAGIESSPTLNSCANSNTELDFLSVKPEGETEQPKHSAKRLAPSPLEAEGKKPAFGSKKASNPAFIAAQSKFEELSSAANSCGSINLSCQDVGVDSHVPVSSDGDAASGGKECSLEETSAPNHLRAPVGDSECGTELSITSTLDSPDRFDDGNAESGSQTKVTEGTCSSNIVKDLVCEVKGAALELSPFTNSVPNHPEKQDDGIDNSVTSAVDRQWHQEEQKPERSTSDVQIEVNAETVQRSYRSSPEASPRSHITIPESQGTPASQVSVKTKGGSTDKTGPSHKRKSLSASKRSPSNPYEDSVSSTTKQLPRDQKNGKRLSSSGSARQDNEQEPRDSDSSNSLPHFMQATESARAKVNSNNSPRSSPDVLERDIYMKKRHSLPGANGRQGSPRIQRSTSQAQQVAKANNSQMQERKWVR